MSDLVKNNEITAKEIGGNGDMLLKILIILVKNKKRILLKFLIGIALGILIAYLMPISYKATAQILPPQGQSGSSALLGQLGGALGGIAGGSLNIKNASDTYVSMLGSRTVKDIIIKKFELQELYGTKFPTDTRNALTAASNFNAGKDGMIVIEVTDKNPERAAGIANAYVEELQKLTQTIAVTEASQRRLFFEKQLEQAKNRLADSEVALKEVQEKTGLIQLNSQAEAIIKAAAQLKGEIASQEVALGALRTFATESNPEYIRLQKKITGLREQLSKVETGINAGKGDISVSTSMVPEAALGYVRKLRDVKYNEAILEMLAKQFELAKIDEAKESSLVQVLDNAVVPDKKHKPSRITIIVIFAFLSLFVGIGVAIIREVIMQIRGNHTNSSSLSELRKYSSWKS